MLELKSLWCLVVVVVSLLFWVGLIVQFFVTLAGGGDNKKSGDTSWTDTLRDPGDWQDPGG